MHNTKGQLISEFMFSAIENIKLKELVFRSKYTTVHSVDVQVRE